MQVTILVWLPRSVSQMTKIGLLKELPSPPTSIGWRAATSLSQICVTNISLRPPGSASRGRHGRISWRKGWGRRCIACQAPEVKPPARRLLERSVDITMTSSLFVSRSVLVTKISSYRHPLELLRIHIQTELDTPSVFVTKSEPSSDGVQLFAKNSQFPLDFLDAIVGGYFMNVLICNLLTKVEFFPSAVLSVTKIFVRSVEVSTVANAVRSFAGYVLFDNRTVEAFVVGQTRSLIFKLSDILGVGFKKYLVIAHLVFSPFPLSCL